MSAPAGTSPLSSPRDFLPDLPAKPSEAQHWCTAFSLSRCFLHPKIVHIHPVFTNPVIIWFVLSPIKLLNVKPDYMHLFFFPLQCRVRQGESSSSSSSYSNDHYLFPSSLSKLNYILKTTKHPEGYVMNKSIYCFLWSFVSLFNPPVPSVNDECDSMRTASSSASSAFLHPF